MQTPKSHELAISQEPALQVLTELGYTYLSPEEIERKRKSLYDVLLLDVLESQLKKLNQFEYKDESYAFSQSTVEHAIRDLDEDLTDGLVRTNEKIYESLMLGRSYEEHLKDGSKKSFTLQYIDWDNPENNVYHVTQEFVVERQDGEGTVRPDIIVFINGIPLGVIECKRASVSTDQAVSQMIRNQKKEYIPQLFKFIQLVMASNKNEVKYATVNTPKKFWSVWKEEDNDWLDRMLKNSVTDRLVTMQDRNLVSLFYPTRFLDLIKYFIIFDKNEKKVTRYQQFFAVKEIIDTVEKRDEKGNRQSGVIWHTQGSGKSLTMVMLAKYILSELWNYNPKVIVVTDRVELDKQIHQTFNHSRLKASKANSGKHLVELINDNNADVVTTLINKFDTAVRNQEPIQSKDIFILVDESHRTQYGELNIKMKKVFPNASYLGFTGTPLMKKEKNTMVKFGKIIHQYTISDGVKDKAILPLLYEGRMVEQTVNRKAIDHRLETITRNLNEEQKNEVMQKWSQFERIASSDQRIQMIALDINDHYVRNYKTAGSQFKAMLATNSKIEAVRYLEAFEDLSDLNAAVVISPPDQREGHDDVDSESKDKIQNFWKRMMVKYGDADKYEDGIKNEFVNGDDIDLLIVVDKLLTGFDAPRASILYIDKVLKEHSLLQAIARVNRLYEGKDYGIIIDYRGLLEKLDEAMEMYSGSGLENFNPEDIKGALYDVVAVIGKIRQHYSDLWDIFKNIKNKEDMEEYEVLLEDKARRDLFYDTLSQFGRHMAIAMESEKVYDALSQEELEKYKRHLKFFQDLRRSVKLRYSDSIDHKEYEAKMQKLMDQYIAAEDMMQITNPVDILDRDRFEEEMNRLGSQRAKADAIRTRLTKSINVKYDENPAYYQSFSERIEKTLEAYKEKRITEAEYWQRMNEMKKEYQEGAPVDDYPSKIQKNKHAQAFYGVTKKIFEETQELDESDAVYSVADLALEVDLVVKEKTKVDWQDNTEVHKSIEQEIDDLIHDFLHKKSLDINYDEIDKWIDQIKTIAMRRY